ncbi:hypothetical protein JYU34_000486 [Plutella xylostella]|uniref:Uncharacterized protein n=2 Tax=Plutella xylostella TaxID=51655 RepID=A0ABQ7R7V4_PLUXY|nr:hypothetical protein JYU34_000486 [Plutella xylostella]CAG9138122.1 unnamed protein product [Plutella xylostella]
MLEDENKQYQLWSVLPTEILILIFTTISAKDLIRCRKVCQRWKDIIDGLIGREALWRNHCQKDFPSFCQVARHNARKGMSWFHLYRSLSLWDRLRWSHDHVEEFAVPDTTDQQILDFKVLQNGIIGVLKKDSIVYYDSETLQEAQRSQIAGHYLKYTENAHVIVILGYD